MPQNERGATAVLVAASLILVIGMAAIAIDLGAGFSERRVDQTAADTGALAAAIYASSQPQAVLAALDTVRDNLPTTFSDPEWQALWEACTDPGMPASFTPLPNPWDTSPVSIACLSAHSTNRVEIRVRVPDQLVDAPFGAVIGSSQINTHAQAHATFAFATGTGGGLPFGVLNGVPVGTEICLSSAPPAQAAPPCDGPAEGNFGPIDPPQWANADLGTLVDCTPDLDTLKQAIALGMDHIILPAAGANGIPGSFPGTAGPHPGDTDLTGNGTAVGRLVKLDDCNQSSGTAEADDAMPTFPINTLQTRTGFPHTQLKEGMIGRIPTDPVFALGALPRLRNIVTTHSMTLREKQGPTTRDFVIDNTPLWYYLREPGQLDPVIPGVGAGGVCDRNTYSALAWNFARTNMFNCLAGYLTYVGNGGTGPLFEDDLGESPRFGWTPQFHYTTWGTGTSWQPILRFVPVYLDGVWFNCNGNPNTAGSGDPCTADGTPAQPGLRIYPQEFADNSTIWDGGAQPRGLRVDQLSAVLLPLTALDDSMRDGYPGSVAGPFAVTLAR